MGVSTLTTFQKSAINQEFLERCVAALEGAVTAADAPAAVRLLLADAASGGVDGSAALFELNRGANKSLAPFVAKLKDVKAKIDAESRPGQAGVSWGDLTFLAARSAVKQSFVAAKVARFEARGVEPNSGAIQAISSPFPVQLGRKDAAAAGPPRELPAPNASPAEIKEWFAGIGTPPKGSNRPLIFARPALILWGAASADGAAEEARLAAGDAELASAKAFYDRSRLTASRTDYEVDAAEAVLRLASARSGAVINEAAYLHPVTVEQVKIT